jgi:peptidoglycan hydrolase CwlO-like protein
MVNIILTVLLIIISALLIFMVFKFATIKTAFDEVLIKMMKDHEAYINLHKSSLKELKLRFDDINKTIKDINNSKSNIKNLVDEIKSIIKSSSTK